MKVQKGKVEVQQATQITSYLGKLVNDHGYETSIYYSLHLLLVTCCYIGQEPHCLLQGRTDTSQMYSKHEPQRLHWDWGDFWSHL